MNKEELLSDLAKVTDHLTALRESFAQHILSVHAGVPATACHKCMTKAVGVRADQLVIADLQRDLGISNSSEQ